MPPAAGRITVDELGRRMERVEQELHNGIAGLHRRLDDMAFVHPETLDTKLMLEQAHRQELERRLSVLESGNQWLWRTIGGIVLTALIVGLLAAAGLGR